MREDYSINKYIKILFYIFAVTIFVGFICAQFFYPDERNHEIIPDDLIYEGTLTWKQADGSQEQIEVPGNYEIQPGQVMVIITTLPEDYDEDTIAIRGSQQNVRFYIEGELRAEYDTKDSRPFGSESASRYVFCKTSSTDAGKELRIELQSGTKRYSGVVNDIFCGSKADIWAYIFSIYGGETIIGMFLLFTGIIVVIFSIAMGIAYHSKINLEYLGWCMILGAAWMIGESKFRQMLVPNASVLANLCFVVIMLCPVPILMYVDSVQNGRYKRLFGVIECIAMLNLVFSSILQFAEIADYLDPLSVSFIIMGGTFLVVFVSFLIDICRGYIRSYILIVIGILLGMVGAVIETVSVYLVTYSSGFFLGAGLLMLLFFTIIQTVKDIREMEHKRQAEQFEKRRKQTETMSLQMIQTLSVTIEAKDEYTRGHSYRVAQYAALIAEELGWMRMKWRISGMLLICMILEKLVYRMPFSTNLPNCWMRNMRSLRSILRLVPISSKTLL